VPALSWPSRGHMATEAVRISVHILMCVLDPNLEASDCSGNGLHLYCLIGVHAINRVISCSLIRNRNLAYDDGT
jgi:hypothetical protein